MSEAYKQAGVNIEAGNEAVQRIRSHVKRTARPEVLGDVGGFGGLFALKAYDQPVLVSATDGVGTKLKIAFALDQHETIGIDCVAMCVNDIIVQGAEPLFFLDYLATGKLQPAQVESIVKGIADGCAQANCSLIGGETAEMPGMYAEGEYDLAGFAVGVVERDQLIDGRQIQAGDQLIGLASSGLHSNGFSLVRKLLLNSDSPNWDQQVPGSDQTLAEALLTPTRIYVKSVLAVRDQFQLKGAAHITGGGLLENVPRILPEGTRAEIDLSKIEVPPIFTLLKEAGQLNTDDLYRTFNMGIGMVLVIEKEEVSDVLNLLREHGETANLIGEVTNGDQDVVLLEGRRS